MILLDSIAIDTRMGENDEAAERPSFAGIAGRVLAHLAPPALC